MKQINLQRDYFSMKTDEKLDIIDSIVDAQDEDDIKLKILKFLSKDKDYEVRIRVAEILVFFNTSESENILLDLLEDNVDLVRVNACDSLCFSKSLQVVELLKNKMIRDKSSLVRGYCALTIVDISNNTNLCKKSLSEFLINALKMEKVKWVKINIFEALYILGLEEYLNLLLDELNNRYYRNRCAIVNTLNNIINNDNYSTIIDRLLERKSIEKSYAVKSSIDKLISNYLSSHFTYN